MKNTRRNFITAGLAASALTMTKVKSFGAVYETAIDAQPKMSAPSDIKITGLKCAYIRGGAGLFVKIESNQEIYGLGEGVDAVPGTYHLVKRFERMLVNRSPLQVNRLFEDMRRSGHFGGAQSGVFVAVLSAIETALWDLAGKALGLPVHQLLGGKFRDKVRVYCDTALYQNRQPTPEDFAKNASDAKAMGFNAIKFDLDQANDPGKYDRYNWTASPRELDRMVKQMGAAREAVGNEIDICADMHGRYDAPTGEKVAKLMEPFNLMWLEEPVPAENVEAYRKITESTTTPICAGENTYLAYGFTRLLETGAVDIIMPDLQKVGGLGEGLRCANLSNLYYVPFAPHMVATFLGAMACAHVCASVPNFMIMEWQIYFHTNEMFKEIVIHEGPQVENSFLTVSDKPGIGVDLNFEAVKKYATQGYPFFE